MDNNFQVEKFDNLVEALRRYLCLIDSLSIGRVVDVTLYHKNGTDDYLVSINWSPSLKEVVERRITRE